MTRLSPRTHPADVPRDACLANAELVLEDRVVRGRLTFSDGVIAEIAEGAAVPAGAEDCAGAYLLPGLVELHTDNLERHMQPRPDVHWPLAAAILAHDTELAATGITTVFDALRVGSIVTGGHKSRYVKYARPAATEILRLSDTGALKISHALHLRAEICSDTLSEELAEFGASDRICLVSLMDHTPGQRQFRDMAKLRAYLMGKKAMTEPEFHQHIAHLQALRARNGDGHAALVAAEAARFGAVLASHDDTTPGQVAASAGYGARLAEFPTTVAAARACREHGMAIMMGAPNLIRGASHSGNVSALHLAEGDLLDVGSSDYVPAALIQAAFRLGAIWGDLARAVACVSAAPANAAGLKDRGRLRAGLRADILRVELTEGHPVVRGCWSGGRRVA